MSGPSSRLTKYQQQQVVELSRKNVSIRKTAELLEIDRGQVWRLLFNLKNKNRSITEEATAPLSVDEDPVSTLLNRCKGKSFEEFWDILPKPDGINGPSPLYPFQHKLIDDLQQYRRVALLAARNLGKSEIALRYGLYMTLCQQIPGNYAFITGIGYTLSRSLCRRVRRMLEPLGVYFDDNSTTLTFPNDIRWSFYGSDSKGWRGQSEVVYLVADEVAHFDDSQDWRATIDTYAIKNNGATIFIITTPGKIDSIAHRLFKEPDDKSLYKHVFLNYEVGIGTMYKPEQIQLLQSRSESFPSEYDLKWGYIHEGSSFTDAQIRRATSIPYSLEPDYDVLCSLGCDPGFTSGHSGAFGITIVQKSDGLIKVKYSHTYQNAEHSSMVNEVVRLMEQWHVDKVWIDSSAVSTIQSIKEAIGENPQYGPVIEMARHNKQDPYLMMDICPVNFGTQHKQLLFHAKALMSDGLVAIDPQAFPNLVAAIQVAKDRDNAYIKSEGQWTDEFDSWRLSINPEMFELRGGNY